LPAADGGPTAARLAQARSPQWRDGAMALAPWVVERPWADEERTLRALHDGCAAAADAPLIVRQRAGVAAIEYGSCRAALDPSDDSVAVLAGPSWTSIDNPAGWRISERIEVAALGATAGLGAVRFAVVALAIGPLAAALLAAVVCGLAALAPVAGLALYAVLLPVACAAAGWRLLRAARRDGARRRLALGYGLVVGALVLAVLPFVPSGWLTGAPPATAPARCLLLGYSSVRGDSLRQAGQRGDWTPPGGMWDGLADGAVCQGSLARRAQAAGRFAWIRDAVCEPHAGLQPGGAAIFYGGSNDDFFWAPWQAGRLAQLLRLARYAYARPSVAEWQRLRAAAEADSVAALDQQMAALRAAMACVAAARAHFLYVHDFLAWDLAAPRSADRQRMLQARAAAVGAGGGDFLDTLDALRGQAGTWWFNDYIHPSALAHRRLAARIEERLEAR
jgi:hypothetical protein